MHILVDEFQDTSRDQYDLLRTLTQDWSSGDGRTLFLVGDPMQSIYGFRNAEVGRFSTVRAAGLGRFAARRHWSCGAISVRRRRWCTGATKSSRACFPPRTMCAAAPCVTWPASRRATKLEGAAAHLSRRRHDCGRVAEAEAVADLIARAASATRPGESIAVLAGARPHLRAVRAALANRAQCRSSA